jgi:hypothetical protein
MIGEQRGDVLHPRRPAIVAQHRAHHRRLAYPGPAAQFDRRFRRARAFANPAGANDQREDVTGRDEIARTAVGVDRHCDRARAIGGRDAGGDPVARFDRLAERPSALPLAAAVEQRNPEPQCLLGTHRQADQPARIERQEIDRGGIGEARRDDEVDVATAQLVSGDEDHPARGEPFDRP